jgi:hypothetical protein
MYAVRLALLLLAGACLLSTLASCRTLALSGAKKYRVEITNVANQVAREIGTDGVVSDRTYAKLKKTLDTYRTQFGKYGTFVKAEEIVKYVDEAKASPGEAFRKFQYVQSNVDYIIDMIRTEVPD